jgi:hypothetical protein
MQRMPACSIQLSQHTTGDGSSCPELQAGKATLQVNSAKVSADKLHRHVGSSNSCNQGPEPRL